MRPDGASMLTMLYEGEPGWSGPPDPHRRPGPSDRGRCLSCRTIWKRGPRMPADDEQLPGSKGQQR
jgi:hypothetical protein